MRMAVVQMFGFLSRFFPFIVFLFYTGSMATSSNSRIRTLSVRERVTAALPLLERLSSEVAHLSDAELVALSRLSEEVGRHVDALRVRTAGEVDARSGAERESSLARRYDSTSAANLLAYTTHAAPAEIRSRIALDRRTRGSVSLAGEPLPSAFPAVAAALHAGAIGVDVAADLTRTLEKAAQDAVIDPLEVETAEREIVNATAAGFAGRGPLANSGEALPQTFDDYRAMAGVWLEYLLREGIEQSADESARYRYFAVGRVRDALVRVSGKLTPEAAGSLQRLLDAHVGSPVQFSTCAEQAAEDEPWSDAQAPADTRTVGQRRHDALVSMVQAAAASEHAPTIGGAAPTLVVTVAAEQLADPAGVADIDGVDASVPAKLAHRIGCTGAVQKLVLDPRGRIIELGSPRRLFTAHQRRAIAARDGGCVIPGCTIPAAWCEIHHVEEHARGGATHTDNGVLLCWAHHHDLDGSGWEIQMRDGVPFVKAPHWVDRRGIFRPVINRRSLRGEIRRRRRGDTATPRATRVS
ncbi:hypothetical protein GCM10010910_16310 [Microbacterium nanhaiense]|uniref:HNH nuclease domain-containing protein n=2 Tax=Microbacterium nanhaiense TaxID=1301026 RepID=A0ABQ2N028_9MICO|nr:hypothetical protein GCM10010910_16310 [Microbacterium nanhaiense]